jgi:signal transduction histidine kinase
MPWADFINYFSVSLGLGAIIAIVSSSIVYTSDPQKKENVRWFLSNFFAAIWSTAYMIMISTDDPKLAYTANLILHGAAIFIPLFYFSFVTYLTETAQKYRITYYVFSVIAIALLFANWSKNFVSSVKPKFTFNFAPDAGPWYWIFALYFFALVILSLVILLKRILVTTDKKLLKFIFFSSLFGFAGGGSVFFLTFNINFPPYPIILFSLYPIIISYAILRHHLFNARVIATETFILLLWLILLARTIILPTTGEKLVEGGVLLGTILIGILLMRSAIKEVKTRERMEALAKELAGANERLTMLDRQKSEFLSIASHQLRSPLTAIKGYSSMMLEGSFGKITEPKLREAVERVFLSSERLVIIIEDFLNVSRIEQGRMQYEFSSVMLDKLVDEVIGDLKPGIDKAGLTISFTRKQPGDYYITADYGKIKQVVTNIIDNSSKYTPHGSINVEIAKDEETRKILLTVSDTGIGISRELLPMLFQKFTRAKGAGLINIQGTGLGLYVVKELMKGNKGNVWVDSPGEGKGSTFYLEFMAE